MLPLPSQRNGQKIVQISGGILIVWANRGTVCIWCCVGVEYLHETGNVIVLFTSTIQYNSHSCVPYKCDRWYIK